MFMEEINAIKDFSAGDFPSARDCDFSLWDKSGIIELLLEEAKRECIETKSLCLSTTSLESNGSEYMLSNLVESEDTFGRVVKKLKELGLKIQDSVEKVEVAVQKNDNNEYGEEDDIDDDVENDIKVNDRPGGENCSKDILDENESSLKEEIEDDESVDSGIHGMSSWDQDANILPEIPGPRKQCQLNNHTVSAAMVCRPCETDAPPSNQLNSQAQMHFVRAAKMQQQEISVGLHCSQNISIEAEAEEEAMDKTSFIGFLLDQLEEVSTRVQ
ncbi:unnamed protein product [Dibothriocephalus latus]|uniref:Uncharacterized protein n=1 Tax=Dibothriocephalus latus TaxID=60516 RepID=A0A3P7LNB9_DIBLA|nr:unnamed protein product [Dibothriocephalus latus]